MYILHVDVFHLHVHAYCVIDNHTYIVHVCVDFKVLLCEYEFEYEI